MNLQTGQTITRIKFGSEPVTDLEICAVETMAADQGITTSRTNTVTRRFQFTLLIGLKEWNMKNNEGESFDNEREK